MTTQFDNLTTAALADEFGALDCQVKALEARLAAIKAELKRRGGDAIEGAHFLVTRSEAVRWTLDTTAIRSEMGEEWCNRRSKAAAVTSFRVKAHAPVALALAA